MSDRMAACVNRIVDDKIPRSGWKVGTPEVASEIFAPIAQIADIVPLVDRSGKVRGHVIMKDGTKYFVPKDGDLFFITKDIWRAWEDTHMNPAKFR